MSQQQHQLPYDFSGVDSTASLYQASQTTPSFATWQGPQSGPIPYIAAAGSLAYGDAESVNGGSQSRVEDWASQAVAATLQQVRLGTGLLSICEIICYLPWLAVHCLGKELYICTILLKA